MKRKGILMRPIKLEMNAFGPYKSHVVLDFTKLNNQTLFLISGPTGAGKTTIFDAIAYALYDDASGTSRNKDAFKSDFATDEDLCYVAFTFEVNGKEYYIKRKPTQKGPGRREPIDHKSSVEFHHDGTVTTKISQANKEIIDLLSLSYEQFKQIVMLPQGEFKHLLESDSKDKEIIFRNIFGTHVILKFQDNLKNKVSELNKAVSKKQAELKASFNYLDDIADPALQTYRNQEETEAVMKRLEELQEKYQTQIQEASQLQKEKSDAAKDLETQLAHRNQLNMLIGKKKELEEKKETFDKIQNDIEKNEQGLLCMDAKKVLQKEIDEKSSLESRLRVAKDQLSDFQTEYGNTKKSFSELESAFKELPEWRSELDKLKNKIEVFTHIEQLQQAILELTQKQKQDKAEIVTLEKVAIQLATDLSAVESSLAEIKHAKNEVASLRDSTFELKQLESEVKAKITLAEKMKKLTLSHQDAISMMKDKQTLAEENSQLLTQARTLFNLNMAGLLASNLKNGDYCPVCGSTEHPILAARIENAPSEEDLEIFQNNSAAADKAFTQAAEQVRNLHEQISEIESYIIIDREEIDAQVNLLVQTSVKFSEKLTTLQSKINDLQKLINQEEEKNNQLDALQHKQSNNLLREKELTTLIQSRLEQMRQFEYDIADLSASILGLEQSTVLESKEILTKKIEILEIKYPLEKQKLADLEQKIAVLKNTVKLYDEQITQVQSRITDAQNNYQDKLFAANLTEDFEDSILTHAEVQSLKKQLHVYQDEVKVTLHNLYEQEKRVATFPGEYDIVKLQSLLGSLYTELNQLAEHSQQLVATTLSVKQGLKNIALIYNQSKKMLKEYGYIKRLSNIANGQSGETGYLSFERYVLAIYYEEIVHAANKRLSQMTDNRYLLLRSQREMKGAGAKGLELDVFDHFTGQIRSVKTLSGGESFKASLALALGLSDVMQQQSGGIQIDTLFIDEGFGTLDSESLEQAIQTLSELNANGRMIGIISHVDELKNRIPAHIKVSQTSSGSHAEIIV